MQKNKTPIGVCITDTHLDEDTIEVNFKVWTQALELCDRLGLKVLFHLGDIFTSRKGQPEIVLNAFRAIVNVATEMGIKIVCIAGNHDKTDYTRETSFIDPFESDTLRVVSPIGSITVAGSHSFHMLPYFDEKLTYATYFSQLELKPNTINILLTHVAIDGIRNNGGTKVENDLKQEMFDEFDLVLVGHYHNRQIVGSKDHIVYMGSAYAANYGEDNEKGAVIVYSDASYDFYDFVFPRYETLKISSKKLTAKFIKEFKKSVGENNVRIEIEDELEESKKPLLTELQQLTKVVVLKSAFNPIEVVRSESVVINDMLDEYDEWGVDIEDAEYGRELLKRNL